MRVSWTERKSNVEVLKDAECVRTLMNKIKKKQASFVGHVMRRNGLENLITTEKFDGRRTPGRQRKKMIDGMTIWMGKQK